MEKIYRQVSVKERLPDLSKTAIFIDRLGYANQLSIERKNDIYDIKTKNWITDTDLLISYDYWLEEVEMPSDTDVNITAFKYGALRYNDTISKSFQSGANYILNTLKGEKR